MHGMSRERYVPRPGPIFARMRPDNVVYPQFYFSGVDFGGLKRESRQTLRLRHFCEHAGCSR